MNSNGGSVVDLGSYDWRQNRPKTPNKWTIKLGNTSLDFQKQPLILIVLLCAFILLAYFKFSGSTLKNEPTLVNFQEFGRGSKDSYNNTYPLTQPIITPYGMKYQIAVIADLDTDSKGPTMPLPKFFDHQLYWSDILELSCTTNKYYLFL